MVPRKLGGDDRRTILLAAHGGGAGNAALEQIAAGLGQRFPAADLRIGFQLGTPKLSEALREARDEVWILPVMAADGYFADVVLPNRIAPQLREGQTVRWFPALGGTDPLLRSLVTHGLTDRGGPGGAVPRNLFSHRRTRHHAARGQPNVDSAPRLPASAGRPEGRRSHGVSRSGTGRKVRRIHGHLPARGHRAPPLWWWRPSP